MSEARTTAPRVTVLPATRNRFTTHVLNDDGFFFGHSAARKRGQ